MYSRSFQFYHGPVCFSTGLSKVGLPGAKEGMQEVNSTIAGLLKAQGYATGQFGKKHLGDRDEHFPTNHGFDEFFGNLYHLNAEDEPENEDYPKNPEFRKKFGPRGVIRSYADGKIEDTGPLTKKRMETVDEETSDVTPFRGEKNTNWEGGWRVPAMVRWPGHIKEGVWSNEIMHHMDWLPTFLAAAGEPDIKEKLKKGGVKAINRTYKNHLDGYNFLPYLTGKEEEGPRKEIFYFSDDGELTVLRYNDWKVIFMEQRAEATFQAWREPFIPLRAPLIENLRRDPYERGMITSNTYDDWWLDRAYLLVPAQTYVASFLETFKEFPPSQKAGTFSFDQVMQLLSENGGAH